MPHRSRYPMQQIPLLQVRSTSDLSPPLTLSMLQRTLTQATWDLRIHSHSVEHCKTLRAAADGCSSAEVHIAFACFSNDDGGRQRKAKQARPGAFLLPQRYAQM